MNKHFLLVFFILCGFFLANAQITILDEDVQEKIVPKPEPFDSLSNIVNQKNPINFKKYIGYKLYCLPISNKYIQSKSSYTSTRYITDDITFLTYKSPRKFVKKHVPFEQTNDARFFKNIGEDIYERMKREYEEEYIKNTFIYKATEDKAGNIHTPYDSIQNTYFTILNIELTENGHDFIALDDWDREDSYKLRITLKNETSGEELYCTGRYYNRVLESFFFLVPYFEKMQNMYKGQNVVSTTNIDNLVDIKTGQSVNIRPEEIWQCYDVTFLHSKDYLLVHPFFLLERDGVKVKISFKDFTEKCFGIFSEAQRFILEQDYNNIIAERIHSAEEKQRIEKERLYLEEQNRKEHNKKIIDKYGNWYGKLICEGQVCLNMTKEMCIEAWGEPNYINTTIIKGLVHEQWVYWGSYLYFDNGILTSIQN